MHPESYWIRTWGVLCCSRSFEVTNFGTNQKLICNFPLVINTNLPPILHCFRNIASDRSKIAIFGYPSCVLPPTERFPWDNLPKIFCGCQWMAMVPNGVETVRKISIAWAGRTSITDRWQTDGEMDGWQNIANIAKFAKNQDSAMWAY